MKLQDVPSVDTGYLMNSIQSAFFDKNPLLIDAGMDNNVSTMVKIPFQNVCSLHVHMSLGLSVC